MRVINKVVVHALVKEQHKGIKPSIISPDALDSEDELAGKLVDEVVSVYGSRTNSAHYGIFKIGDGRGPFPDEFKRYAVLPAPTDAEFLRLTKVAMVELYGKASIVLAASGGYLLFADYTHEQNRYFVTVMIKQKPGISITKDLKPEALMLLELERLHQAARINFAKFAEYLDAAPDEQQEINYLSFVSPSTNKTTSGYFVTALGCAQGSTANQATRTLIKEGPQYFEDSAVLRPAAARFRQSLMEYLSEKSESGQSVRLVEVGELVRPHIPAAHADNADILVDEFVTHLNSDALSVPSEFPASKTVVRAFTNIKGKANGWQFEFEKDVLGTDEAAAVYYDEQENTITIRNIPDAMKASIEAEIQDRQGR
tara:strand:- start:777 stop:1886 length:1110 start_codon:yes stop_codon:yes gene_type:complete